MPVAFNEAQAEQMVINACTAAGWKYVPSDQLPRQESDVLVDQMLKAALIRLNPCIAEHPAHADTVIYKLRALISTVQPHDLVTQNERFKKLIFEENSFPLRRMDVLSVSVSLIMMMCPRMNSSLPTNGYIRL